MENGMLDKKIDFIYFFIFSIQQIILMMFHGSIHSKFEASWISPDPLYIAR
jgi:hypothetical protein